MNKLLVAQLANSGIKETDLTQGQRALLQSIDESYTNFESQLSESANNSSSDLKELNAQLQQDATHQYLIINNIKAAIAALEPEMEAIQGENHIDTTSSDISYLTNSLIRLTSTYKGMNNQLKDRAGELEKVNLLLKKEKQILADEQAKDQAVLLAIGDGLVVTNTKDEIQIVNNSFEQLLGFSRSEIIGKKMSEIIKLQDKFGHIIPEEFQLRALSIKTGKKHNSLYEQSYKYHRKDSSNLPVRITAAPIIVGGKIIGAVEVFQDITQERELNKAKTEFVSIASHQLRTPLSAVNWYTEILLDDKQIQNDPNSSMYLGEIMKAKDRMTDIINALLDVSRIDLGTFNVTPEKVEPGNIINIILKELNGTITKKNLTVTFKLLPSLAPLTVDARLITIVFQNLISNAVKYTPPNGTIDITLTTLKDSDNQIYFSVKDTGYGIPEKDQEKIFTKMFRANNIKKVDTDGNGLGLYIVKSLLEVVDGTIWFKSKPNTGTTFHCLFPRIWKKRN